ncbi:hypothetical protein DER46DRAFT_677202 [Fusarium sp. MPI-SDFR-AT-0072]|nr:hypothetical protein DER46DRAFT_677202 [Fusarium sp. MPI-SDFR-AT-0072]
MGQTEISREWNIRRERESTVQVTKSARIFRRSERHSDHGDPDASVKSHEFRPWKSTMESTQINEMKRILEEIREDVEFTSVIGQEPPFNKSQRGRDHDTIRSHDSPITHNEQNDTPGQQYESDNSTRLECVFGVCIGSLLALICISSGIYVLATRKERFSVYIGIHSGARETLSLGFNIILTFCFCSMAFVHSVSLRWALYSEHPLESNTNLRLFTSSTKSGPNRWYTNIFSMFCLVISYGASSYLLLSDMTNRVDVNGLALLGHTLVSTWCLWTCSDTVLKWSSNHLKNCLAAVQKRYA